MKTKLVTILLLLVFSFWGDIFAGQKLKIAYVDMNQAINLSQEGLRSKKFLEAQFAQTKSYLQKKEKELVKKQTELRDMIMLTPDKKRQKQDEIMALQKELREELGKAQQNFRADESRHTEKIYKDLILVVKKISAKKKYDLVLESRISQAILYSKFTAIDITKDVIKQYNKIQKIK